MGRITNQSCTSTAQSRPAEIGTFELHEIGRWRSVHRHCLLSTTGRGWYCFHDGKSFMKVRQPLLCSLLTHSFLFVFTPHAHYPFGLFLVVVAGWHTGVALLQHYLRGCVAHEPECFFDIIILEGCVAYQARRGADRHERRAQGQRPGKKHSQANMPRQGIGKRSQAGNWQSVPGRDCKTCPGRALANVPRQRTGKRSQAGNWQASQAGTASMLRQGMHTGKRSQAWNWQAFPGRELASVPRQGTGKRSQAGNWQASQAGTANVPRQGTCKCSQAGNRRRPQAGGNGCSHAGNCRHCKSLATICHQPRCATPPPTSRVLCDKLACLLTGRGAIVICNFNPLKCVNYARVTTYSMSVSTTPTHLRMHHINSIHTCSMLASNTHASHQQPSLLLICFCFQQLQTNPSSTPPFFLSSHSHTTTHFLH